ncbi:unnamed protein product [Polarella glacialis]|uniref:Uncharacterized protein n=1 Tax=Polarella glacialis TaxID=89957 RepID=A0A813GYL8_POLGL|nr:unnamed protein product [Polarella glacialis]
MSSSDSNSDSGSSPSAPGESVLEASSVDVMGLASSGGGDAFGFHGHFWHFRGSFLVIFLGSGLSFGVLPSLNPIACFDPLSRLATAFVSCKKLGLLTVTFTLAAALVAWEAFARDNNNSNNNNKSWSLGRP